MDTKMPDPIRDARDLRSRVGDVVDVRGRYDLWDMGPHRVMTELPDGRVLAARQVVNLVLDDGSTVRLWVRPDTEMKALGGRAVVVRGTLHEGVGSPSPASASPSAALSLLDIERIELA